MRYLLAALPILFVLGLMILRRWGGQRAGPAGWLAGGLIALLAFGLNWQVLWVSQLKGLFLSLFVLAILWPALFLYHVVDGAGGIRATAQALEGSAGERGLLLILLAWAFSGLLEGLAGFGLPIAIVAPMLVGLGVPAVRAVAAVAVGHAWSVTFGDMSVIFQTLAGIVDRPMVDLAPMAALFLGIACIACGLGAAFILGQGRHAARVVLIGLLMAGVQYGLAVTRLVPLAVLVAGLTGLAAGVMAGRWLQRRRQAEPGQGDAHGRAGSSTTPEPGLGMVIDKKALLAGLASYGLLTLLLGILFLNPRLYDALMQTVWQVQFPATSTAAGFGLPAGAGQALRPLVHPGTYILLTAILSYIMLTRAGLVGRRDWQQAARNTWRSAAAVSAGILSMVGLSTLMDHSGMTFLLAQGLSDGMGTLFPLASPLVGVLGAFATGSNNNSNVLFAPLQNNVALLLSLDPRLLLAAQTSGGSLGSMIAPAKIIVGCSTVGIRGKDGEVLKITLPYCLAICVLLGALALSLAGC